MMDRIPSDQPDQPETIWGKGAEAEAARRALLKVVRHASLPPETATDRNPAAELAREASAGQRVAWATSDDGLLRLATDEVHEARRRLAGVPALDTSGIALKLATLLGAMLADFDTYPDPAVQVALLASALADCVVLGAGGPITLPANALAGVRNSADAALWRSAEDALKFGDSARAQ